MFFRQIADDELAQYAYLVGCQRTGEALLIDPQRDVDRYLAIAAAEDLRIVAVAETHIHADFLSGARELARQGVRVLLSGEGGRDWQYGWPAEDGVEAVLLRGGDVFRVGSIDVEAVHTPGHTPEHLSFMITDAGGGADEPMGMVSGDFVFVGDLGRPDLLESAAGVTGSMKASAHVLHDSVERCLDLPDYLQIWPGHGAGSACGKALGAVPDTTVGYERRFSPALAEAKKGEEAFVSYILEDQPEPPLYFGRMKRLNRDGPPLLGGLPRPTHLSPDELARFAGERGAVVLDTRAERSAFMRRHLAGSLYAPLDRTFPTVAGSFVDAELPLYLIANKELVEDAVRSLVRIGLDRVAGWSEPDAIEEIARGAADPHALATTEEIDVSSAVRRAAENDSLLLDVRRAAEFREGHLPGAVNLAHTRLGGRLSELPPGRTLLVYCRTGSRSAVASAYLEREGFRAVYVNGRIDTPGLALTT